MLITIDKIKSYNPCKNGIDEFENKYSQFNDSLSNLLQLNDVSYSDKIWLACKVVDVKTLQQWSVECAEFIVDNYNSLYPSDTRISDCIETTKRYLERTASLTELSAATTSAESAARSAARLAAWSAWSATSAARLAAWSAESAARSATSAVWSAMSAEKEQEDINLSILIALLEGESV